MLMPRRGRTPMPLRMAENDFPRYQPRAPREESDRVHMLITLLFQGLLPVFARIPNAVQRRTQTPEDFRSKGKMFRRWLQAIYNAKKPRPALADCGAHEKHVWLDMNMASRLVELEISELMGTHPDRGIKEMTFLSVSSPLQRRSTLLIQSSLHIYRSTLMPWHLKR